MSHDERDNRPGLSRRRVTQGLAAGAAVLAAPAVLRAQTGPVRIGYAMARTGPWTGGAQVSQEPNYLLWADQVNAAGGLNVKGTMTKFWNAAIWSNLSATARQSAPAWPAGPRPEMQKPQSTAAQQTQAAQTPGSQ